VDAVGLRSGPDVDGRSTTLFCAWLGWSRFRVVLPLWDRSMPSVVMGLDRALRAFGGAPTYALFEYVPRDIFGLRCPTRLCAGREVSPAITVIAGRVWPLPGT